MYYAKTSIKYVNVLQLPLIMHVTAYNTAAQCFSLYHFIRVEGKWLINVYNSCKHSLIEYAVFTSWTSDINFTPDINVYEKLHTKFNFTFS